jgi:hypothetical protein
MARFTSWSIVALLAAWPALAGAADDPGGNYFWLELRPRYNRITETDKPLTTRGGTLRAIMGARWAIVPELRLTVELLHANNIGAKHFNDDGALFATSPYPLLPDPEYTGFNRAQFEYDIADSLTVRVGRQRVALDNQRWVSDNDFRQIPQLFEGVTAISSAIDNVELQAGRYRRIRSTSGSNDAATLMVAHAAWNPTPAHAIAAFGYWHDQPRTVNFTGFANNSYRILGIRAEGTAWPGNAWDLIYTAEIAHQDPYAGGDARIDARYWRAGIGAAAPAWTARFDYEVRGSNGGRYGLQTPLTDFYGFNGWTLHFFTVPQQGLRDGWVTGRWEWRMLTFYAEAHRFRSDFGSLDLGRELDVGVTAKLLPNATLRLQHARYDHGSGRADADIRKTWLTLTYTF